MGVTSGDERDRGHGGELVDHWWWRPGWGVGRRFYAWHVNGFGEALHRLVGVYQRELSTVAGLDLIPGEWLHLTMQGVGFVEDVLPRQVDALRAAARRRLGDLDTVTVRLHRPVVHPEAVLLPAVPDGPLQTIRYAVRAAIGDVFGAVPENADGYHPHISLAYSNADQPAAPILEALDRATPAPVDLTIGSVSLIELHRDNRLYEWQTVERIPLGR